MAEHFVAWEGVVATVPGAGKKASPRQVLTAATGYARSGSGTADGRGLVAIMGPSGAGKSTLLTLLAGHDLATEGTLKLDGRAYDETTGGSVGFVPQQDRMFATLTVEETVRLSARLRGVGAGSRVDEVLRAMGLEEVRGTRIGDPLAARASQRGVSGGERKRCALALELLHAPPLLVVDEPTSGLDSRGAVGVMRVLAALAERQAVVCSLHQPSARAFAFVGQLGLLSSAGRTLFFGPAAGAPAHFKRLGQPVPPLTNAAEHYLELVGDVEDEALQLALSNGAAEAGGAGGVGFGAQLRALWWRSNTHNRRNPAFLRALLSRSVTMALVIGHLYGGALGASQRSVQDRTGALYFVLTNQIMSSSASLRTFIAERDVVAHERRARLYALPAYFLARSAAESALQLLGALLFGSLAYGLVGLAPTAAQLGVFLAVVGGVTLVAESHVVLLGALMADERAAAVVSPLVLALLMVSGGLFINPASLPPAFALLSKANLFTYGFAALLHNEFAGLRLVCEPHELVGPPRQQHCPVEHGEQVIRQMAVNELSPAQNLGVLALMLAVYRLLAYLALKRRLRSPLERR